MAFGNLIEEEDIEMPPPPNPPTMLGRYGTPLSLKRGGGVRGPSSVETLKNRSKILVSTQFWDDFKINL